MILLLLSLVTSCGAPYPFDDDEADTAELRLEIYSYGGCFSSDWPGADFLAPTTPNNCKRWRTHQRKAGWLLPRVELENALRSCREMEAEERLWRRPLKIRVIKLPPAFLDLRRVGAGLV